MDKILQSLAWKLKWFWSFNAGLSWWWLPGTTRTGALPWSRWRRVRSWRPGSSSTSCQVSSSSSTASSSSSTASLQSDGSWSRSCFCIGQWKYSAFMSCIARADLISNLLIWNWRADPIWQNVYMQEIKSIFIGPVLKLLVHLHWVSNKILGNLWI